MAKRAGLRARLERLETQQQRRPYPRVILALCPQEEAGEIVGFNVGNVSVMRLDNETAKACAYRVFALAPDAVFIAAIHAGRARSAVRREEKALGCPDTAEAPHDPYALAGIGRTATRDELMSACGFPIPPERLI